MHASILKYFIEVASCGSVRKASERLYVAASAVNRQIHKLEDELGVELGIHRGEGDQVGGCARDGHGTEDGDGDEQRQPVLQPAQGGGDRRLHLPGQPVAQQPGGTLGTCRTTLDEGLARTLRE